MKKLGTPSVEDVPSVDGSGGVRDEGDGGAAFAAPCPVVPVDELTVGACPVRACLDVARGCACRSSTRGAGAGSSVVVVAGVVVVAVGVAVAAGGGGSGVGGAGTVVVPVAVEASEFSAVTVCSPCA